MIFALVLGWLLIQPKNVLVTDFGSKPNTREEAGRSVQAAIASLGRAEGTVEFPPGDYHFYRSNGIPRELYLSNSDVVNPRQIAILIEGKRGLHLKGNGARLIFHDRIIPIAVLGSQKISIDGFTVDWERPLMSQGIVMGADAKGLTLRLDKAAYPYQVSKGKLFLTGDGWTRRPWSFMEFDPATKGVAAGTGDNGITDGDLTGAPVTEVAPGLLRFEFKNTRRPKVGNVLIIRHGVRDHAGAFIQDSKDVSLSQVFFRHTSGLGVLCQYSENIFLNEVDVAPDPGSQRLFAGHDDGFHFSNCKGHILVERCRFEGLMDDPINVHGTAVRIQQIRDRRHLRCRFMHPQSVGLKFGEVGDEISVLDHESLLIRSKVNLVSISHHSPEEFSVGFDRDLPQNLVVGDALENLTWTPTVTIKDSVFGTVRARGLLVSTPRRVLVEGCTFRSSGAAILIPGDANGWYESGAVTDVTIRHNLFEKCNSSPYQFGDSVINVCPEIPRLGRTPFHHGIHVDDNVFIVLDSPIFWVKSAGSVSFNRNQVIWGGNYPSKLASNIGVSLIGCEDVEIKDNRLDPNYPGRSVYVEGGKPRSLLYSNWK